MITAVRSVGAATLAALVTVLPACTSQALPIDTATARPASTSGVATSMPGPASSAAPLVPTKYLALEPDTVHLSSSGHAGAPVVDLTVRDAPRAKALLRIAARLEPAILRYCPFDQGYAFAIEWSEGTRVVATAGVQAQGCRDLSLDGGGPLMTTSEFWDALTDLFGLTDAELHPRPF